MTETLAYTSEDTYPQQPRQPESPGTFTVGPSPDISNPVLQASDVADVSANLVADPFVVFDTGTYHMVLEIKPTSGEQTIGHATSPDGLMWSYDQEVLSVPGVDLSYPYVFKEDGTWYMAPNKAGSDTFDLYTTASFQTSCSLDSTLFTASESDFLDATPVKWNGRWYVWGCTDSQQEVSLYHSNSLKGNYSEHSSSSVTSSVTEGRPAGRPISFSDGLIVFYMDSHGGFGKNVRAFYVSELTADSYSQSEISNSPILSYQQNGEWNDDAMHHIDVTLGRTDDSIAVVDGQDASNDWSISVYRVGGSVPAMAR